MLDGEPRALRGRLAFARVLDAGLKPRSIEDLAAPELNEEGAGTPRRFADIRGAVLVNRPRRVG